MLKNPDCLKPTLNNLYYPPANGDYVYFETTSGLNASWAADAAMLAYARYQETRMNAGDLDGILSPHFTTKENIGDCFVDNASTGRGFFAGNNDFAILAFRGTEKGNNHDLFSADGEFWPVAERGPGGQPAGKVHTGFQKYLTSIWPRVKQLVDDYRSTHKTQPICITGHSLGAAIATLAFHQLQDAYTSLYTFGCPRVGNQDFCRSLEKMAETRVAYRFIDHEDVVTELPLAGPLLGYQHPNFTTYVIDEQGGIVQNPLKPPTQLGVVKDLLLGYLRGNLVNPIPTPLADHSPVRYCHWLSLKQW